MWLSVACTMYAAPHLQVRLFQLYACMHAALSQHSGHSTAKMAAGGGSFITDAGVYSSALQVQGCTNQGGRGLLISTHGRDCQVTHGRDLVRSHMAHIT